MRSITSMALTTIHQYPSIAAGSCAFAVAFALVAGNALYAQPGGHPVPLWATRDAMTTKSIARQQPGSSSSTEPGSIGLAAIALERIPVPLSRPQRDATPALQSSLVADTQKALKLAGYYDGEVDGLYGRRTRDAIIAFQRSNSFSQTGQVSISLLSAVRQKSAGENAETQSVKVAARIRPEEPTAVVEKTSNRASPVTQQPGDVVREAMIARIQIGLINLGESGVSIDGLLGPQTISAVKRFQAKYGLPTTGEPDTGTIRKLEEIGALRKS
ncbi:MAG: peptidoglycan-binding domain-containing protein [Nitratireductor sp.]